MPFIDDHIHSSEIIVDYLTEFSGIKRESFKRSHSSDRPLTERCLVGDLYPGRTRYTLTPLKVVYKKLRLLVDSSCIFIGHGLSKDFRIIGASLLCTVPYALVDILLSLLDIFVPPEQVIDTVDLYYLENRQRRLPLRFLTWFVLKENIQTETHDSIEDTLSALKLYKVHLQLEAKGTFDDKLDELYREGGQYVCSRTISLCEYDSDRTMLDPAEL